MAPEIGQGFKMHTQHHIGLPFSRQSEHIGGESCVGPEVFLDPAHGLLGICTIIEQAMVV